MKTARILGSIIFLLGAFVLGIAAFSHRLLPPEVDECQQDVSHEGHIADLPMFHCLGHTEFNIQSGAWDHVHPWMDDEWLQEHAPEHPMDPSEHDAG